MPTCKDCIHYDICLFHLTDNANENCVHFKNTADVVPRSEVAREIFEEIDGITDLFAYGLITELELYELLGNRKKKYTEGG